MTNTITAWVLTAGNRKHRTRHQAGHARLGPGFTRCGHPVGQSAQMSARPCRACAAALGMPHDGPWEPTKPTAAPQAPSVRKARQLRAYPGIQERLVALREDLAAEAKTGDDYAAAALFHIRHAMAALRGEV